MTTTVLNLGRSFRVQQFRCPRDDCDNEYTAEVHRCVRPSWVTFRVTLHGPTQTTIVADFDVHVGRYGGRDEQSVELSAISEACASARRLTTLLPWQLRQRMHYQEDRVIPDWVI